MSPSLADWPQAAGLKSGLLQAPDGTSLRVVSNFALGEESCPSGPPVVLLHGAPQHAFAWRKVIQDLNEPHASVALVAPDLRGYGMSGRSTTGQYDLPTLCGDLELLMETLGVGPNRPGILVAHDWGAPIAFQFTIDHPTWVKRLIISNGPHLGTYLRGLRNPSQMWRSWYTLLFQLPHIERLLRLDRGRFFGGMMVHSAPPGLFEETLSIYREGWDRPGRPAAIISYYRHALREAARDTRHFSLPDALLVPTTVIWGKRDLALAFDQATDLRTWIYDLEIIELNDCSHWVPEEHPGALSAAIRTELDQDRPAVRE